MILTETEQLKAICIAKLQEYVGAFQERRAKVTDEVVKQFMAVRPLEWQGNPKVPRADLVVPEIKADETAAPTEGGPEKMTKNQLKKLLKEQQIAAKKAEKAKQKEEEAAKAAESK